MNRWAAGYTGFTCTWMLVVLIRQFMNPDGGTWPDWVAAFGTILAFGGTIWIATNQSRQQAHEKRELAVVTAAALMTKIVRVSTGVTDALNHLNRWGGFFEDFGDCAQSLRRHPLWSSQELVPLVVLPNNAAAMLAAAAANVDAAISLFEADRAEWQPGEKQLFIDMMKDSLNEIRLQLNVGLLECYEASRVKTEIKWPEPTGE